MNSIFVNDDHMNGVKIKTLDFLMGSSSTFQILKTTKRKTENTMQNEQM